MTQSNPHLSDNASPTDMQGINNTGANANATVGASTTGNTTGSTTTNPATTSPTSKTNSRVEVRDYTLQPSATVALLPSIAEERQNGFPQIPYNKSVSLIEQHQKLMSPPTADFISSDKSEVNH